MNPKAQEYIDKKLEGVNKKKKEERNKFLIREGLYEKVYPEKNEYTSEFSYTETDPNTQETKYYNKVAIDVTDEEFEEIKRALESAEGEIPRDENAIADFIKAIGVLLYIAGVIAGFAIGSETESFVMGLLYFVVAFISGTSFLGFSEIINLLNDIKNKK